MRTQLLIFIIVFVSILLALTYLFQIVFLQDFYTKSSLDNIEKIAVYLKNNLDNEDFPSIITNQARNSDVCIRVISNSDYKASSIVGCTLNQMDDSNIAELANKTIENGGSYLASSNENIIIKVGSYQDLKASNVIVNNVESYTYSIMANIDTINPVLIMVNTQISPINPTVTTLQSQFVVIGFIALLSAIILAIVLGHQFITPLEKINKAANSLASGEYDGKHIKSYYEEASNINNTLIEANGKINEADKVKRDLIANVSHDLRTPLTMIRGYSEMMRDLPNENNRENAQIINDEATRLSSLVTDLLDLSKLQDNKISLEIKKYRVNELIDSVYKQYLPYCKQHGIILKKNLDCNVNCDFDVKRIKQVLYNFINNAITYGNKENLTITITSKIINDKCRIDIIDNGVGIEEEKLELIWDRYYKMGKKEQRDLKGSGIGLNIAKGILEAHKCQYNVESEINKGSDFYFYLNISKK